MHTFVKFGADQKNLKLGKKLKFIKLICYWAEFIIESYQMGGKMEWSQQE